MEPSHEEVHTWPARAPYQRVRDLTVLGQGATLPGGLSRRAALKLGPLVPALGLSALSAEALAAEALPRVDARAFGAVGDGVADDTAALRSALAASRCVELTHGTYRINGPLPIDGHQILLGCGSTLVGAGNHVGIRRGRDPRFGRRFIEFPVIRDLRLEGFSIGLDATGMSWGNFQNLVTARCGIGYRLPTGHLGTCYYNTFTSCHVVETGSDGENPPRSAADAGRREYARGPRSAPWREGVSVRSAR